MRKNVGTMQALFRFGVRALACTVGLAVGSAHAVGPEPPAFGMVTVGRGQTAILHVVLRQPLDPMVPPRAALCRVELSFVDAAGQVKLDPSGAPVMKTVDLQPNVAASLQLPDMQSRTRDGDPQRATPQLVRPVVAFPAAAVDTDCSGLATSLEVVDLAKGQPQLAVFIPIEFPPVTLYTAPLGSDPIPAAPSFRCAVANVGDTQTVLVHARLYDVNGGELSISVASPKCQGVTPLGPREKCLIFKGPSANGPVHCEIMVLEGNSKLVRASLNAHFIDNDQLIAVTSAEAR